MGSYWQDSRRTIYQGDARAMAELADESVQCVITSPPYWGLRKYAGLKDLVWDSRDGCQHEWGSKRVVTCGRRDVGNLYHDDRPRPFGGPVETETSGGTLCSICGAWRGSYGLEPTPELYVQHTVEVLREIRRVLRKDGVVFWNIGDSYASIGRSERKESSGVGATQAMSKIARDVKWQSGGGSNFSWSLPGNIKPKDLCLIPFRVAIAAQEDGWWVRSVIIWSKNNPMPESVKDRPTRSHEYILMLTKSANYYWDADAVREPHSDKPHERGKAKRGDGASSASNNWGDLPVFHNPAGRNIRSVWEFPTQPYPDAHFAVFPEKLPETCIKAATKEGDLVLDPFMGSGTTLLVAAKLGRRSVGFDLSAEYCELAVKRNRQGVIM